MFNLLVKSGGWADTSDTFDATRLFEHTSVDVKAAFVTSGQVDYEHLASYPALFLDEARRNGNPYARVGKIHRVRSGAARNQLLLTYSFNPKVAPIHLDELARAQANLGFTSDFEFNRTHWAVKDADLYEIVVSQLSSPPRRPNLFQLPDAPTIDHQQVSVMMPFKGFTAVYDAITRAAKACDMKCNRADDIWAEDVIMADVVGLIDRAAIVISDCTGKNANVFYEIGLSHAWGKKVILITQDPDDIPFDLSHIRHLRYRNNAEGLEKLELQLAGRIDSLLSAGWTN
ncbi:hypothetical protein [Pseudomonas syringae]|uniref:hypothetical protein n=1 Tax=Pseudomonas syringae TaxID=317 RepID=UPI001F0780F3|nr:hypothetical protein [Pseudomonas syringae]